MDALRQMLAARKAHAGLARSWRWKTAPQAQSEYRSYRAVHPFDERLHVDTSGLIYDLPTGSEHDGCNYGYFAVAPSIFKRCLERLPVDCRRFRFIDLGSGKGRALLLAAEYPFRQVIGVELCPRLHRIAQRNIRRIAKHSAAWGSSHAFAPAASVQADAADFPLPSGPLIVYMWNSFGQPVMRKVLENLRASYAAEPREIFIVYMHPELEEMLDREAWLTRLWSMEIEMSEEDYAAWAFPARFEHCAVYHAGKPETRIVY